MTVLLAPLLTIVVSWIYDSQPFLTSQSIALRSVVDWFDVENSSRAKSGDTDFSDDLTISALASSTVSLIERVKLQSHLL